MGGDSRPCGRGGLATSDGWCNAPLMSSEETPPCSVPSSSPHKIFDFAGPQFFLPEENETAPAGACRRPTAAERRLLGRRQTGRARSTGRLLMALPFRAVASPLRGKEKKKYTGDTTGARLNDRRSRNDFPHAIGLSGGLSDDEWASSPFRCRFPGGRKSIEGLPFFSGRPSSTFRRGFPQNR